MSDTRYVARIPIVPDDFENKNVHKNNELVMDFTNDDIYVKKDDAYVNITGKIKNDIKQIHDGSAVIHIVTEETLPMIENRSENNWYYVVTYARDNGGEAIPSSVYVYYGLIKTDSIGKNYLLIGQNVTSETDTVKFVVVDGYCPCFYVPENYSVSFVDHTTGSLIENTNHGKLYALNTTTGTYHPYNIYTLNLTTPGEYLVDLNISGSENYYVTFQSNITYIQGLVLPDVKAVKKNDCIGEVADPTWEDARYIFHGWSTDVHSATIIDTTVYKPEENMTLYAWFTYEDDPSLYEYYSTFVSEGDSSEENDNE